MFTKLLMSQKLTAPHGWSVCVCGCAGVSLCLTCVGADVASEQPGPGEGLAAGGAHAGQRVRADVHLQGSQAGVLLRTVLAEEGRSGGRCDRRGFPLLLSGRRCCRPALAAGGPARSLWGPVVLCGLGAGGVRGAPPLVFLPTTAATTTAAAAAEAEAGRRAEVQGGCGGGQAGWGHGELQGWEQAYVP